jgi:hypothetical protein
MPFNGIISWTWYSTHLGSTSRRCSKPKSRCSLFCISYCRSILSWTRDFRFCIRTSTLFSKTFPCLLIYSSRSSICSRTRHNHSFTVFSFSYKRPPSLSERTLRLISSWTRIVCNSKIKLCLQSKHISRGFLFCDFKIIKISSWAWRIMSSRFSSIFFS